MDPWQELLSELGQVQAGKFLFRWLWLDREQQVLALVRLRDCGCRLCLETCSNLAWLGRRLAALEPEEEHQNG